MDNYAYQPDDNGKPFAITRYPSVPREPNEYFVEVNSRSKLFRRPKFYKILIALLIVLVLLLLIVIIVLAIFYCTYYYENRICTSEECLRSASNLRLSVDLSVDPCEDFYKYTCGRWSKQHPNHGWFASFSAFSTISEKILIAIEEFLLSEENEDEPLPVKQTRSFYQSCMDLETMDGLGLSVLYKYLQQAELPQVPSIFTKTDDEIADFKFDWLRSDAVIKKTFAMDVLIGFAVDASIYNRSENVMYVGVPGQRCPLPSPLTKKNKKIAQDVDYEQKRKTANTNIMKFVIGKIIKNATSEEAKEETLQHAVDILLNMTFQIDSLVENFTEFEDARIFRIKDFQKQTNEFLINNINKEYPEVWENYVNYLFEGVNVTIDFDKDLFYLGESDIEYLPRLVSYVLTTSDVYLELYMWWVTVFAMIINTSSDVVDYILKQTAPFYSGSGVLRSRSLDCTTLVNSFMGMAVSYGVADRAFSNKTKPKVEQMLYDIKSAFVEHVNTLTWMDKETKQATLEKSREMVSFIGYPEWLFAKGSLDLYYQSIVINNDTFLDNMMAFIKSYMPSKFEDLRTVNERNWSTEPTTVNAFNSFQDNAINLPMAILNFPIYHLGLEVLNYGAIGTVLGHELTHGFDNTGRKHDKYGNYKEWWTNETRQTFEEKIECFVRQYDNFTITGVDNHVQGKQTLGENIADNGGLNHAYRAYHNYLKRHGPEPKLPGFENFTHDQLFFIAFGSIWCETISTDDLEIQIVTDEHSPNNVRVLGSLQNSKEFAQAYNCPVGSKMNPNLNKCKVW